MEREPEYIEDIKRRCAPWMKKSPLWWSSRSAMNFPQRRNNLMETGHLAEITIKINVDETTDRDHIAQWLEMAMALDAPMAPIVTRSIAVGDESMSVTGPKAYVEQVMQTTDPAAAAHPDDQYDPDPDDETGEQQADEQQEASTGAGLPAPRRRGRRSNAEKAAEREAQERAAAAQPAAQQAAPRPAGAALPPGITMPGAQPAPSPLVQPNLTVAQGPAPTPVAPQEAAMPHVEPSPALGNGAIMALEDFREAVRELHQAKQGFPLLRMRAPTWMDGSAKPVWFTIESVPDIHRVKLIDDISNSMIAG
jgi:hypothetical protein